VDFGDLPVTVKPNTTRGRPPGTHTAPTAPSMSTGWANRARPEKVPATAVAPRTSPVRARIHGCAICSEHDVWVQQRQQRVEVAAARGGEEGVDGRRAPPAATLRAQRTADEDSQ
jgi:hypothetical protein